MIEGKGEEQKVTEPKKKVSLFSQRLKQQKEMKEEIKQNKESGFPEVLKIEFTKNLEQEETKTETKPSAKRETQQYDDIE